MSPTETSRHRTFFPAMSVLLAVIVYYGFASTYYRRPIDAPPIPVYLHAHGVAMTMWFTLLILQTTQVATGRRAAHRRIGDCGAALSAAIALLTPFVVVWFIPGLMASEMPISTVTLIILGDLFALAVFAILLMVAIRLHRQPEAHARFPLLASIPIGAPAVGRASIAAVGTPIPGLIVQMSLPFCLVAHDLLMTRRVHYATSWGTVAVVEACSRVRGRAYRSRPRSRARSEQDLLLNERTRPREGKDDPMSPRIGVWCATYCS